MDDAREKERARIRAKMPDDLRAWLDTMRECFPDAKLTYVEFSDGEIIGRKPEGYDDAQD